MDEYNSAQVGGFVARARDVGGLRTPRELRDGLGLDDRAAVALGERPWTPIPLDAEHAYQLRWNATDDTGIEIPYGAPENADASHLDAELGPNATRQLPPFTGTGTTSGGVPEWLAKEAPIGRTAQIWRIGRDGNEQVYAEYDAGTNTWK